MWLDLIVYHSKLMKLSKPAIPKELDADVAISIIIPHAREMSKNHVSLTYDFKGVSKRTALGDELIIGIKNKQDSSSVLKFSLKRDSLYHILPEYLFHPLDHYLNTNGDSDEFDKRYKEQEEQKNKALTYFGPFDQRFQEMRVQYQEWLNENIFKGNHFLAEFITEGHDVNLNNSFIRAVYPCISWLRCYRGNDELIRTALSYAFDNQIEVNKCLCEINKNISTKVHTCLTGTLDELYCGTSVKVRTYIWKVFFQTKIETTEDLYNLKQQIEEFSEFFSIWFLPIDSLLDFNFGDKYALPILYDKENAKGIFLNYSTQLI